jgi:serine-type D-Ala-D-Ala carboxypeptidase/endopeptidase (penicillin-binding protein 4)
MDALPRSIRRTLLPALLSLALGACVASSAVSSVAPAPPVPRPASTTASAPSPPSTPTASVSTGPVPTPWGRAIDRIVGHRQVSVAVRVGSALVYGHLDQTRRAPASNEKLLLSMTALSELGADYRIPTKAAVEPGTLQGDVVHGDLWIVGHGDPEFDDAGARMLAAEIRDAGIRRITGAVLGDTTGFLRDRHAPGWHPLALNNVGLPTALSFDHNVGPGGYVLIPELSAARAVTRALRSDGVTVGSSARADTAPDSLRTVATVRSAPLADILRRQNITSDNTDAETLNKLLGARFGGQGSIEAGSLVIRAWLHDHRVDAKVYDASGLSYRDRISPFDLTRLLSGALRRPWGRALRASLPAPGQGTLVSRLIGIPVRAKTGTLTEGISALSGYVRLPNGRTATFSILSRELGKDLAVRIEDAIVRIVASKA